jgi:hypothetical protein
MPSASPTGCTYRRLAEAWAGLYAKLQTIEVGYYHAILAAVSAFPLVPVALNSCILVGLGILFHRLSRRVYPRVAPAQPTFPSAHATTHAGAKAAIME